MAKKNKWEIYLEVIGYPICATLWLILSAIFLVITIFVTRPDTVPMWLPILITCTAIVCLITFLSISYDYFKLYREAIYERYTEIQESKQNG